MNQPALTLGLAVQPEVLHTLARRREARERGLLARFLVAVPPSNLGRRKVNAKPVPRTVAEVYDASVRGLFEATATWNESRTLTLTPSAHERLVKAETGIERELLPDGRLAGMLAWGSKLAGLVVRLAALLHIAEHPERNEVSVETVERALAIGRFAVKHARAAFEMAGANREVDDAKAVLGWLRRHGEPNVSRRDIHRSHQARFSTVDELERALAVLIEHGWLRAIDCGPRRGRPTALLEVHPALLTR